MPTPLEGARSARNAFRFRELLSSWWELRASFFIRVAITVMFSDLRGFTTISEKLDAQVLALFQNGYLSDMTRIVSNTQGTLDKYIGDAVLAFWGAPY